MIDIIPSILVKTKDEFLSQITSLEHTVNHVQLDIADGKFVPNSTWSEPEVIRNIDEYTFELHLMDQSPLETIVLWKDIPNVTRFIIHTESVVNLSETLKHTEMYNKEIFIALNPNTGLEVLKGIENNIEGVLFMGVNPGFQGQKLIPSVLEKISECRKKFPNLYTELDGGVHEDTLKKITASGVHAICPGSLVFKREHSAHEQIVFIKNKLAQFKK